ncbi:MAG: hypothetical protein KKE02_14375 [Alphaproteobacteria bacterium]|nr:hypothetical protein [Alphaproteobacteria bacterium]MBU1513178.1 hypothetical protein [Alphaproteobacteria bacterium]MBU2095286.1 hypothetical protein [Alphaproteobacteria bacterium]MBU2152201.1 hypothetical protein [Alphaproteobacteria bacterium]MBU2306752.1 hypothetical protein [Alphaproteobacteria bacterium]
MASLIERTARWVAPETFQLLPVWYPAHARGRHFFKGNWSAPQMNMTRSSGTVIHKVEGNIYANNALTLAVGLRKQSRPNWSCCHLWGVDDPKFQKANAVVQDRRFYSCVANMVLLPTPLKAFTDSMFDIKAMLRVCARNLYRWECDHEEVVESNLTLTDYFDWADYPESWPKEPGVKRPHGVIDLNPGIQKSARERLAQIRAELVSAGEHYPRDEVLAVLDYWGISPRD